MSVPSPRPGRRAFLLALLSLGACGDPPASERPNVLFVFLDTVRADRMSPYRSPRPTTPHIMRLAERGAVFEDCQAPAPWTLPSAASMLTGLHPYSHGAGLHGELRNLETQTPTDLAEGVVTLSERFQRAGYRTEAFATNPHLRTGLSRGYDAFQCRNTEGSEVVSWALERVEAEHEEPWFLLLQFMDAHDPLLIPTEDMISVTRPSGQPVAVDTWARDFKGVVKEGFREHRLIAYDAALHYVDRQLARLFGALTESGALENMIVVITSDHGEEVLEHAEIAQAAGYQDPRGMIGLGHGHALFQETLHVPLILFGPGIDPGRYPELVSLTTIAPTLVELCDLPASPDEFDGQSLVPLMNGERWEPQPILATSLAYGTDRKAWITPEWKLILGSEGERDLLYGRTDDRTEQSDRLPTSASIEQELRQALTQAENAMTRRSGSTVELSEEDAINLQALGYTDSAQD